MLCAKEIVIILVTILSFVSCQYRTYATVSETKNVSVPIDVNSFPGELCYRNCNGAAPRICYFHWHLEHYQAMGA